MSGYAFNSPSDAFASLPVRDITVTLVKRNQNFHSIFFDRFYAIFHTRRLLPSLPLIMGVFKQEKIMLLSSFFFDSQWENDINECVSRLLLFLLLDTLCVWLLCFPSFPLSCPLYPSFSATVYLRIVSCTLTFCFFGWETCVSFEHFLHLLHLSEGNRMTDKSYVSRVNISSGNFCFLSEKDKHDLSDDCEGGRDEWKLNQDSQGVNSR